MRRPTAITHILVFAGRHLWRVAITTASNIGPNRS